VQRSRDKEARQGRPQGGVGRQIFTTSRSSRVAHPSKHENVFSGPEAAAEPIPRVLIWLLCPFMPKAGANGSPKTQPNLRTFSGWQLSGSDIVERAEKRTFWVELPESAWQRIHCRGPSELPRLRSGFHLRATDARKTAQLRLRSRVTDGKVTGEKSHVFWRRICQYVPFRN
jgi:hypothetical protein